MFLARILIISLFIVYSNKYSFEQFSEFLSNQGGLANVFTFVIDSRHEFRGFFESSIKVLIVVAMSAGAFFGVAPFLFCKKPSTFEESVTETEKIPSTITSRNVKVGNVPMVSSPRGVAGSCASMTEFRNKIGCFRDLLDFSPCAGSATLLELLVLTLHDIFQRYPKIKPDSEFQDACIHKSLRVFCDTLQSLGDLWTTEKWMVRCRYDSSMKLQHSELEHISVLMLEDIIKLLAQGRLCDEMDDDDNMSDYSPAGNAFSKVMSDSYFDNRSSYCGSPMTPTSVLQGAWNSPTCSEKEASYSPHDLMPDRVGKLSLMDMKRLSFHMIPHARTSISQAPKQREHHEINKDNREDEVEEEMEMIDVVIHGSQNDATKISSLVRRHETNLIGVGNRTNPHMMVRPCLQTLLELPIPPSSSPPLIILSNLAVAPPPPPLTSTPIRLPVAPLPPPPPPPPMMTTSKGNGLAIPPPPPPPMGSSNRQPPPPPLAPTLNGSTPPPPPGSACLSPRKSATKLKRSSNMGNLYRTIKGKVEGLASHGKSAGRKAKVGGVTNGGKQGMADALAEMTKRSAYFIQIEEDVKNYKGVIKELKTSICSFQPSDMAELIKFHKHVESHLEKLSDETQVLARFEDFPSKKLEAIRMSATLHLKLDAIATTLRNWQIVAPVGKLLDKAEGYFNKIKVELDALERTKDEELKRFQAQKINFDFGILIRIKEMMVDVSSCCMELALMEKREAKVKEVKEQKSVGKSGSSKILWRAFQFAFRVYTFAGGHDDRADKLTREVAHEIESQN